jgi:hypothetical protein
MGTTIVAIAILVGSFHVPFVIAAIPAGLVGLSCLVKVKGRRLIDYARAFYGIVVEKKTWIAPLPMARLRSSKTRSARPEIYALPPELAGLNFSSQIISGDQTGVVKVGRGSRQSVTCTAELSSTTPFLLLTEAEQGQLLSRWAMTLDSTATEDQRIKAIQWIVRITPSRPGEAENWAEEHFDDSISPMAQADYMALLSDLTQAACGREYYLSVDVASRAKKGIDAVSLEVAQVLSRLKDCDLTGTLLSYNDITRLVRATLTGQPLGVVPATQPGEVVPKVRQSGWDYLRVDDLYFRVACVANWPLEEVGPAWLQGLLGATPKKGSYTISVHFVPTPPSRARSRVRSAVVTTELARQTRKTADSAQVTREALEARGREQELVDGYREHRIGAVVMVSAPCEADLEEEWLHLTHAADSCGISLRTLYLEQKEGVVAALPLCRLLFNGGLGGW